jgi:hypothetical protein
MMEQSISGHIVRLLPGQNGAILSLDNARTIAVNLDCMPKEMFERLHIGDRVWYFPQPGDEPPTDRSARVIAISARYGANYGTGAARPANG